MLKIERWVRIEVNDPPMYVGVRLGDLGGCPDWKDEKCRIY